MTLTQLEHPLPSTPQPQGKPVVMAALSVSLILHAAAALLVISNISYNGADKGTAGLVVQEIMLGAPHRTTEIRARVPLTVPVTKAADAPTSAPEIAKEPQTAASTGATGSSEAEQVLKSTPLGMGMMHGYFSSIAEGKSLREDIREYYFEIVEKINREWWKNAGNITDQMRQDGFVEVLILRDGSLASVRTLQKTGSRQADDLLASIIRASAPFPPLPRTFEQDTFQIPLRIKAPTTMFRLLP
jgi:protein TonB